LLGEIPFKVRIKEQVKWTEEVLLGLDEKFIRGFKTSDWY